MRAVEQSTDAMKRIKLPSRKVLVLIVLVLLLFFPIWYFNLGIEHLVTMKAEADVYPLGVTEITCTFRNNSIQVILYGNTFSLERYVNDKWELVHDLDSKINFTYEEYRLLTFQAAKETYEVWRFSQFSEPADYRIALKVHAYHPSEYYKDIYTKESVEHTIYCYFSVA